MIKDRCGNPVETGTAQNSLLKILYGSVPGRALLKVLTLPSLSKAVGAFMDSPLSVPLIKPFIRKNSIDMSQFRETKFRSYNQFFTRKIRPELRPVDMSPDHLISPCDSKLTAYSISPKSVFTIKNSPYSVADLLNDASLARRYSGGYCLIFRLCVDDYHRYCFIDSGKRSAYRYIPGELHTVNPIALEHYNIYKRNCREYAVLRTESFGNVVQAEVGALLVGRICNDRRKVRFRRGEEKGKFEFGGSTVVVLLEKDRAVIDPDILENSANGIETIVKYGEKIGTRKR